MKSSGRNIRKSRSDEAATPGAGGPNAAERSAIGTLTEMSLFTWRNIGIVTILGLLTGLLCLFCFRNSVEYLFSNSSDEMQLVTEEFDNGVVKFSGGRTVGDPLRSEYGMATAPGSMWSITWTGKCLTGALPLVRLHAFSSPGVSNRIGFRLGDQVSTTAIVQSSNGELIVASGLNPGPTTYSVTFESVSTEGATQPALALDRIVIGSRIFPRGTLDPNFYLIFWAALLPLTAFTLAGFYTNTRAVAFASAVGGSVVGAAVLCLLHPPFKIMFLVAAGLTCLVILFNSRARENAAIRWPDTVAALIFASLVLSFRWGFLIENLSVSLQPDAADYMQIAQAMRHPFDTNHREPLYLWAVRLWLSFTAWSPVMLRCMTLALSLGVIFIGWKLARLFLGTFITMLVAGCYVFSPVLIGSSVQGLREELFPLMLLIQAFLGVSYLRAKDSRLFWLFVVASGLIPLVRLTGLIYVIVSVGLVIWQSKTNWRQAVAAAVIVAAMITPMSIFQFLRFGEPFYSSNSYVATFYRNLEFQGKPGYPTTAELQKNPWAGERVSMGHYMFKMHSLSHVISTSIKGTYRLLFGSGARTNLLRLHPKVWVDYQGWTKLPDGPPSLLENLLVLCFVGGLVYAVFLPQGWLLLVLIVCIQLPLSFLEGTGLIDWRLTMNGVPVMLIIAGIGLSGVFKIVNRVFQQGDQSQTRGREVRLGKSIHRRGKLEEKAKERMPRIQ